MRSLPNGRLLIPGTTPPSPPVYGTGRFADGRPPGAQRGVQTAIQTAAQAAPARNRPQATRKDLRSPLTDLRCEDPLAPKRPFKRPFKRPPKRLRPEIGRRRRAKNCGRHWPNCGPKSPWRPNGRSNGHSNGRPKGPIADHDMPWCRWCQQCPGVDGASNALVTKYELLG